MRIAYLFTSFPVLSETFLQREIRAMRKLPVEIEIYSLHKGNEDFEGMPVKRFHKLNLIKLLWLLPYRYCQYPRAINAVLKALFKQRMPSWMNCCETLLGLAFAIINADKFNQKKPDLFHAVWATMPASAAMLLREFTGVPYTMGAHAYDIFRFGGDWLLPQKLLTCRMIHTTTEASKLELIAKGAKEEKISLIRRGLSFFPEMKKMNDDDDKKLRILSVGRMVEKKGYGFQMKIYRALKDAGIPFEARIVGSGPLRKEIRHIREKFALKDEVIFLGKLDYSNVVEQYDWADVFVFTGIIASDGDRDGLPNVIPEAMAIGTPVITTPISGTTEAITHEETGLIAMQRDIPAWVEALQRIKRDKTLVEKIRKNARQWVENEFCAEKNARKLSEKLKSCAEAHPLIRSPWLGKPHSYPDAEASDETHSP